MVENHASHAAHRRKRSDTSFDIDDDDRQFYYSLHGRPEPSARISMRRSRILSWALIAVALLLFLVLLSGHRERKKVDWSKFAYSLYATDTHTLCNAFMVFDALKRLGSKADRILNYPHQWDTTVDSPLDRNSQLLQSLGKYKVKLNPVELQGSKGAAWPGTLNTEAGWDTSITKLLAFELTTYERVLHLDGDITLLQNLDELFMLPKTPVAMPRAYWADVGPPTFEGAQAWPLTSLLVLLQPNMKDFNYMMQTLNNWRSAPDFDKNKKYDMDLLNHRFGSSAMVLPHRPYALLSAEFRRDNHSAYLGVPEVLAKWDADAVFKEAKLVHFSDWPLPKPWVMWPPEALAEIQPKCAVEGEECAERRVWKGMYDDFRRRRKDLCRILSVPAPKWENWKAEHGAGSSEPTTSVKAEPTMSVEV